MTIARITELRELLRQARLSPTMQAEYDFASGELFAHHDELLSAADAVRRLLAERRYPTPGFTDADRVRFLDRVLDEMEATC